MLIKYYLLFFPHMYKSIFTTISPHYKLHPLLLPDNHLDDYSFVLITQPWLNHLWNSPCYIDL